MGTNVALFAVTFYRNVEILVLFGPEKTRDGMLGSLCCFTKSNTNFTKYVNNETLTLIPETREEI
jgi:hypothetical protein